MGIRMGSAVSYDNGGLTPGIGVKFTRTNRHSGNYVALHSLDFGGPWNFFANNLSNHIPPPSGFQQNLLVKKFNQASNCAPQVGLSDMAKFSQDGTQHDNPIFPFKLFLVPGSEVQQSTEPKDVKKANAEMRSIAIGKTLYTVWACGQPSKNEEKPTTGTVQEACGDPFELGDMVTTSICTSSAYGDKKFHIRPQPVEEDWEANEQILKHAGYDHTKVCGKKDTTRPASCTAKSSTRASPILADEMREDDASSQVSTGRQTCGEVWFLGALLSLMHFGA